MIINDDVHVRVKQETQDLLIDLINIPSTRGNEGPAIRYLHEAIHPYVDTSEFVYLDESILDDPDYAFPLPEINYRDYTIFIRKVFHPFHLIKIPDAF